MFSGGSKGNNGKKRVKTTEIQFNPFIHNDEKWSNILSKPCRVNTARFLKSGSCLPKKVGFIFFN